MVMENCIYSGDMKDVLEFLTNEAGVNLKRAIEFATRMHEGQFRTTGGPYVYHPLRVAALVKTFKKSKSLETLLEAAVLHDCIEDTNANYYDIVEFFGPSVASLVLELTTDEDMKDALGKTEYLEIKMKNMSSWALTLKLCDRLDNCSDLGVCKPKFREKYVTETCRILEFLVNKRDLSHTQVALINEIIKEISLVVKDNSMVSSIETNLMNKYNNYRLSYQSC